MWKLKRLPIGDIIESHDIWKLLSISDGMFFSAKGLASSNSGIFRFLTGLEKNVFKVSALLPSCKKMLSPSTVKGWIVFQNYLLLKVFHLSFITSTY